MLTHIARLWLVNDICCFLWSIFAKRNRSWNAAFQFTENQTATVSSFGRFHFYASQRREGRPKQPQLPWFLRFLTDFRSADFRIARISAFPVFRISGFLHFRFGVSTCIRPRRAGWMEGLFEVVVLKFQFSDPKWNLLNWCSDSRPNSHLWKVVLPSYLARNVTQFHLFGASDCQHGRFKYGRIPAVSKAHLLEF